MSSGAPTNSISTSSESVPEGMRPPEHAANDLVLVDQGGLGHPLRRTIARAGEPLHLQLCLLLHIPLPEVVRSPEGVVGGDGPRLWHVGGRSERLGHHAVLGGQHSTEVGGFEWTEESR